MLKTIIAQKTKAEPRREILADTLRKKQPRLGALADVSRDDALACISASSHSMDRASTRQSTAEKQFP